MFNGVHSYLKSQSIPFGIDYHSSYRKKASKKRRKELTSYTDSYLLKMRQVDSTVKHIPKKLKMKILLPFTSYLGFVKAHYKGNGESTPSRVTFVTMKRAVNPRRNKIKEAELFNSAHNSRFSRKNDAMSEDSSSPGRQLTRKAKMIRIGGIDDKSGISLVRKDNRTPEYIRTNAITLMKPNKPCLMKKPTKKVTDVKKRVSFDSPLVTKIVQFMNSISP